LLNEEEDEPTRCYLVFYYTYDRLNMFRAALCPSSGAHDYIADYHMGHLILRLLMVGGLLQAGLLKLSAQTLSQSACTKPPTISNIRIRRPIMIINGTVVSS
jgi:hypothetical protein